MADAAPAADDLALYVHWPFCKAKCPYCDFNSHVREAIDQARWRAALVAELDHVAQMVGRRRVTSIFFGGGTPSLMAPQTAAAVIARAADAFDLAPECEITLEANPTSVEAAAFQGFRAAGVNRVSLGVQALNDADLGALGRQHSAAEARAAVALAARLFGRFSFDLIYARPGQTEARWRAELAEALTMAGDHLSVYQLTIEPGTAFEGRARRGELDLPDEDTQAGLYEATQEVLEAAGLAAYEISNHARPGAECRHNLAYWGYRDYAGIGPGAHGRLTLSRCAPGLRRPASPPGHPIQDTVVGDRVGEQAETEGARDFGRVATRTHRAPEVWLERVERSGHGEHPRQPIDAATAIEEALMMGLRLSRGVDLADLAGRLGSDPARRLDTRAVDRLVDAGLLARSGTCLRATPAGLQRLNAVLAAILA
ncbi:MAG: coproporphyrinogen III oxidase [Rhodospirillaceae bacterium]|nr:coproporphyrinogen III oxidase [Rhodospirillaceae bacterium]